MSQVSDIRAIIDAINAEDKSDLEIRTEHHRVLGDRESVLDFCAHLGKLQWWLCFVPLEFERPEHDMGYTLYVLEDGLGRRWSVTIRVWDDGMEVIGKPQRDGCARLFEQLLEEVRASLPAAV